MGATGSVFVEQLTAKDSVEEVMNQINAGNQIASDASSDQKEKQAKMGLLLPVVLWTPTILASQSQTSQ